MPNIDAIPTAFSENERKVNERLGKFLTDSRSGKARPAAWVPVDRRPGAAEGQVMSFIRGALGRPDPKAPPADRSPIVSVVGGMTKLQDKAWHSLTEAEQVAVNDGDLQAKDLYDTRYHALLAAQDEEDDEAPEVIEES